MASVAHIHPMTPKKSIEGGRVRAAMKSQTILVQYCEDCLWGNHSRCQYGLKRCEEKKIWTAFLDSRKVAALEKTMKPQLELFAWEVTAWA